MTSTKARHCINFYMSSWGTAIWEWFESRVQYKWSHMKYFVIITMKIYSHDSMWFKDVKISCETPTKFLLKTLTILKTPWKESGLSENISKQFQVILNSLEYIIKQSAGIPRGNQFKILHRHFEVIAAFMIRKYLQRRFKSVTLNIPSFELLSIWSHYHFDRCICGLTSSSR